MLTEAQFYLRVLEEMVKGYGGIQTTDVFDQPDLSEYFTANFAFKDEDEDEGESLYAATAKVDETIRGFVQEMGRRVGIDLKFVPE